MRLRLKEYARFLAKVNVFVTFEHVNFRADVVKLDEILEANFVQITQLQKLRVQFPIVLERCFFQRYIEK